jgi:hypothetical protein
MLPRGGRIIGRAPFTDGIDRDVYEDAEGQQYVQDDDGSKVFGPWLPPTDEPRVVDQAEDVKPAGGINRAGVRY